METKISKENPDKLLNRAEVAKYLNISESSVDRLRLDGYVPYVKLGRRKIRYKESDLQKLIETYTFQKGKPRPPELLFI